MDEGCSMAEFLLLPPRPVVGEELARMVRQCLPGVRVSTGQCVRFLEELVSRAERPTFLVYPEDLPEGEDAETAIRDGYGAGSEDRVVRVRLGAAGEPWTHLTPSFPSPSTV
jgi:hypothetical protein